jgi:hypothetical protein
LTQPKPEPKWKNPFVFNGIKNAISLGTRLAIEDLSLIQNQEYERKRRTYAARAGQ